MTDPRTMQYGDVVLPPTPDDPVDGLVESCDPVLAGLTTALSEHLNRVLNPAWSSAALQLSSTVVAQTHHREPGKDLAHLTWRWPVLAMWRESEKWTQRTLAYDSCEGVIRAAYILPPLTVEAFERLAHIRHAVVATIRAFLENHGDPSYNAGVDVLADLGIEWIWLTDAEYGSYQTDTGTALEHPAVRIKFDLRERQMPYVNGLPAMTSVRSDIESADESTSSDVVETDYDPTT